VALGRALRAVGNAVAVEESTRVAPVRMLDLLARSLFRPDAASRR
jgi:hypothetical protein